ncbi:MAG: FkbM family methyltransferase [Candidatus Krumholzibacteria bacterium]
MTKQPTRLTVAQKICRPLPPVISQKIRTWLYPYATAQQDNYEFLVRSQTGSRLRGTTKDFHGYPFSVHGYYEWRNTAIALAAASAGDVIIEVGANVGTETVGLSDIVGEQGKVHAFEPLPSNADFLRDLARRTTHPNIVVHTRALSDKNETATFQIPVEHMSGSGFTTRDGGDSGTGTVEIHCSTLDSMSGDIEPARIIFMDTEGEEIRILRGAAGYIRQCRPAIVLEASPQLLHRAGFTIGDLYREVTSLGYAPYKIVRFGLEKVASPDPGNVDNWLCVTRDQRPLVGKVRRSILACGLMPCVRGLNPLSRAGNSS